MAPLLRRRSPATRIRHLSPRVPRMPPLISDVGPPVAPDTRQFVWDRDGGKCRECGRDRDLQFDHIIPRALGGSSNAENVQLLCGPCNRRKSARLA